MEYLGRDTDRKRALSYRTNQRLAVTVGRTDGLTPFLRLRQVSHALDLPGTPTILGYEMPSAHRLRSGNPG